MNIQIQIYIHIHVTVMVSVMLMKVTAIIRSGAPIMTQHNIIIGHGSDPDGVHAEINVVRYAVNGIIIIVGIGINDRINILIRGSGFYAVAISGNGFNSLPGGATGRQY